MHNNINKQRNENEEEIGAPHGRTVNMAAESHINTETESDPLDVEDIHHLSRHHNLDDDMAYLEKETVQMIQK